MSNTEEVLSLLRANVEAFDGSPLEYPSGPYVSVFDDSGHGRRVHYDSMTDRVKWTHRIMAVARTSEGLRWLVGQVRNSLSDARLTPDASMLSELQAGPVLTDGNEGDIRHSKTIVYTHTTPRSTV